MEPSLPFVLTLSGSDSSGGAGMQADNRAIQRAGGFPLNVITAVTLQTPEGVAAAEVLAAESVERQLRALLRSYPVAAIKIGMLATADTVVRVSAVLTDFPGIPVVLDPVLRASSGRALLEPAGVTALREVLMPKVRLSTPNLEELACLVGRKLGEPASVREAGGELARSVGGAILVKGGHAEGDWSEDYLFGADGSCECFSARRVRSANTRGTGCALSAWIAARLALDDSLAEAIRGAKRALTHSLADQASRPWTGAGPAFL